MKKTLLTTLLVGMAVASGPPADNANVPDHADRSEDAKSASEAQGRPDFAGKPDAPGRSGGGRRLAADNDNVPDHADRSEDAKSESDAKGKPDFAGKPDAPGRSGDAPGRNGGGRRLAADNENVPDHADRSEDAKSASDAKGKPDFAGKPDAPGRSGGDRRLDGDRRLNGDRRLEGDRRLDDDRRLEDESDDTSDDAKANMYACCKFDQEDLVGTILFKQGPADDQALKAMGMLYFDKDYLEIPDDEKYESRYMAITDAEEGTCAVTSVWPFDDAEQDKHCALKQARFDEDGIARYRSYDSPASLYGDYSVIGKSVTLYGEASVEDKTMDIDACCTITSIDEATFNEEYAKYKAAFKESLNKDKIPEKKQKKSKSKKSAEGGK